MGTDIYGYIEARMPDGSWRAEVPLRKLLPDRDRDAFTCLFGAAAGADFEPLADCRGLPEDVSEPTRVDFHEFSGMFSASWISWAEVLAMDVNEVADGADFAVYTDQGTDGEQSWVRVDWRPEYNYDLFDAFGLEPYDLCRCRRTGVHQAWPPGAAWLIRPDLMHRVEPLRRIDVIGPHTQWGAVWRAMAGLAERHGAAGVRLVVWFGA